MISFTRSKKKKMNFAEFLLTIPVLVNLYAEQYYQDDKTQSMVDLANESNVPLTKVYDFIIGKFFKFAKKSQQRF